ncbi:MAG: alpha/beta hydrolase [bacterium]
MNDLESVFVNANGIRFHCKTGGKGPLCLFLHGFPDTHLTFHNQAPKLARSCRVVVPDLRGYGRSDAPPRVSDYRLPTLIEDVRGIIRAFGDEQTSLIAHDWGATIAVHYAETYSDTLSCLAVSNGPHLGDYSELVFRKKNLRQFMKSWYILMNQVPWLSEHVLAAADFALLERLLKYYTVRKGSFSDDYMEAWKEQLRLSGLRGGVNYYRAGLGSVRNYMSGERKDGLVTCPVKVIWAKDDKALEPCLARSLARHVNANFELRMMENCGHWLQHEAPEEYYRELMGFLGI